MMIMSMADCRSSMAECRIVDGGLSIGGLQIR
jgi:hypothetical protein